MPNIIDVIDAAAENDDFLEDMIVLHQGRLLVAIEDLENNITNTLSTLQTTPGGRLMGPKVNLKQAQHLHKQLVKEFESQFNIEVSSILGDFSEISNQIQRSYRSLGEAAKFTNVDKVMMDTLRDQTFEQYVQFGEMARDDIANAMYSHVVGGAKFSTLLNTVKGVLTGHKDARGRPMTQYAKQYANDSIMNYHNQVNTRKGEELGLKHFLYYGDIILTSRQFCITRVGKVYTKRQIGVWDRMPWAGKSGPAFENRGGYNCRHHWRPVKKEWVLDEDGEEIPRGEKIAYMLQDPKTTKLKDKLKALTRKRTYNAYVVNGIKKGMAGVVEKKNLAWWLKQKAVKELGYGSNLKATKENLAMVSAIQDKLKSEIKTIKNQLKGIGDDVIKTKAVKKPKIKKVQPKAKKVSFKPKPKVVKKPKEVVSVESQSSAELKKLGMDKYIKSIVGYGPGYDNFVDNITKQVLNETDFLISQSDILESLLAANPIDKVRVYNGFKLTEELAKGSAGQIVKGAYTPWGKKYISMATREKGFLDDVNDLRIGNDAYSVGSNASSIYRHEFGHHVYQTLMDKGEWGSMGVKGRWQKLHKELTDLNPKFFDQSVSKYAGANIDEAFAECFSAYTSPYYGETVSLHPKIDKFMENLFEGVPVKKVEPQKVIPLPKRGGKEIFSNAGDQKRYNEYKEYYDDLFSDYLAGSNKNEFIKSIKTYIESESDSGKIGKVVRGLRVWKASTNGPHATALKIIAHKIENVDTQFLKKASDYNIEQAIDLIDPDFKNQYIRYRALTQSYYDTIGVKKVKLYRGTGGHAGRKLSERWTSSARRGATKFDIEETSLTGYSGSKQEALGWGQNNGGVTVELDVDTKDIFASYDIWTRGGAMDELEYIKVTPKKTKLGAGNVHFRELKKTLYMLAEKPLPASASKLEFIRKGKVWYKKGSQVTGENLEILKGLKLPPAWDNARATINKKAKVLGMGKDKAGRWQSRYSQEYMDKSAKKKFERVQKFTKDMPSIKKKVTSDIAKNDPRALLLDLEQRTGIRVGSTTDFKAKKKAYGLTTLNGRHVKIKGSKITLDFVAKEGIPAHYEVTDSILATFIKGRKAVAGQNGMLFPDVNAKKLNKYLKGISGGKKYTIKDFRTYIGTQEAYKELTPYIGKVLTDKEKKDLIKKVSEKVSKVLANTPAMAKKSYIDPMVWELIGGVS